MLLFCCIHLFDMLQYCGTRVRLTHYSHALGRPFPSTPRSTYFPLVLRGAGRLGCFSADLCRGVVLPRPPLSFASGGPISFSSERNGGKNAAKNPWFLDFLPAFAAALWFVRNVESTYFSERCRFYSEMQNKTLLQFASSAAAGTEAGQCHISGGFRPAASAWDAATARRSVRGAGRFSNRRFERRFCPLLPPRAKVGRAGARNIPYRC